MDQYIGIDNKKTNKLVRHMLMVKTCTLYCFYQNKSVTPDMNANADECIAKKSAILFLLTTWAYTSINWHNSLI